RPPIARADELLPPGFRPLPPGTHALVGAKIVIKPGQVLDHGNIIIRDGFIKAVGTDAAAPPDPRIWDMKGLTIYAGFIDPYVVPGSTNSPVSTGDSEPVTSATLAAGGIGFYGVANQREGASAAPGYEVAKITPDYRSVRDYAPQTKTLEPLRELGFT